MKYSVRKSIWAIVILWLLLPTKLPYSETGYSWSRPVVEKCVKTTSVFFVSYPDGTVLGGGVIISKTLLPRICLITVIIVR
jgi:hypothetical protein